MPDDAPAPPLSLHERDLALWAEAQARALAERRPAALDWDNLAEEIDSLGRSQRREIRNRLSVLLLHLLKWELQPERRKYGWRASIMEQRSMIEGLIDDSPGLRDLPAEALASCYRLAVARAREEAWIAARAVSRGLSLRHGAASRLHLPARPARRPRLMRLLTTPRRRAAGMVKID